MGEQENVTDSGAVGEQHDQTVDANAHAASRRHAVLESTDVIVVEAHGLVVAEVLGVNLSLEALSLIDGVVQLGEGVSVLVADDEQLETLGVVRIGRLLLSQRGNLQRMVDDEGGLNELLLGNGLEDLGNELALAPGVLGMAAVALENGNQILTAAIWMTTGGHYIGDVTSGMRLFNKKMIKRFGYDMHYSPEPDTLAYLLNCNVKIREIQVEMHERIAGVSYLDFKGSIWYMMKMLFSIFLFQWVRRKVKE